MIEHKCVPDDHHNELPGMWEKSDLVGGETDAYPTEWQVRDGFAREEWRQLDVDTYEVKNPDVSMVINKEGWDAYNSGPVTYLEWLNDQRVTVFKEEILGTVRIKLNGS